IHTTQHHSIWSQTRHTWVDAGALQVGEALLTDDHYGSTVRIVTIHNFAEHHGMYDLTVRRLHTYYVIAGNTPVLVHNCNTMTVDELANAKPIHGIDPDKAANLRGLSDEELLNSFNNPDDGGHALVGEDGRIWNGHHRINEIVNRAADPNS